MREYGLEPQVILTTPLLEGTDGVEKMSKSLGNYIGFTEDASDIFGKVMSISDTLMFRYFELLTDASLEDIEAMKSGVADGSLHPMELKTRLGSAIVRDFHGEAAARRAREHFARVHQRREEPENMPELVVEGGGPGAGLTELLVRSGMAPSKTEARRLFKAGAVSRDGVKITDPAARIPEGAGGFVLRCGKLQFCRVRVR
jgi:tyrosyl-tRNA synthetase